MTGPARTLAVFVVLSVCLHLRAEEPLKNELKSTDEAAAQAELKTIADTVKMAIGKINPSPQIEYSNQGKTLTVTFLPQTFKVHNVSLTGEVSKEAHDEIGPSYQGFVLSAHLQPKGEVNMLVTPQTIRRPYWNMDLDVTQLAGSDKQAYWALSYGSRTDKAMLDAIREKIKGLKE